jgi:hypothetical protein
MFGGSECHVRRAHVEAVSRCLPYKLQVLYLSVLTLLC